MKYFSTRSKERPQTISSCIIQGLAPDGGLYVPESLPTYNLEDFTDNLSFADFAALFIQPFFNGDEFSSAVPDLCKRAFNFPLITTKLDDANELLELYHGPTCAFKDYGARFLAEFLQAYAKKHLNKKMLILVATSGDTGGAVASAFYEKDHCLVGLLFPQGSVSTRQKAQLTGWGKNIHSFKVKGSFDDCQKLVKEAFASKLVNEKLALTSANSINIARLLPQASYFAYASLRYFRKYEKKAKFVVPSGNMGNVFGAFLAKACGFPIEKILIATNSNATISEFYKTGKYSARPSVKTLANAMDVGAPSNMERLLWLEPNLSEMQKYSQALLVNDEQIKQTIKDVYNKFSKVICPHTAVAFYAKNQMPDEGWIIVSTAHPAKFEETIESLINQKIDIPPALSELMGRKEDHLCIEANLNALLGPLNKL